MTLLWRPAVLQEAAVFAALCWVLAWALRSFAIPAADPLTLAAATGAAMHVLFDVFGGNRWYCGGYPGACGPMGSTGSI